MARLNVRVQPGARCDRVVARLADGTFKVAVTAPPVEGRANDAVTRFIAKTLGIKGRNVRIVKGLSSRSKWIEIDDASDEDVLKRLEQAIDEQ